MEARAGNEELLLKGCRVSVLPDEIVPREGIIVGL